MSLRKSLKLVVAAFTCIVVTTLNAQYVSTTTTSPQNVAGLLALVGPYEYTTTNLNQAATAQTLRDLAPISVKDFGATGNGSTNDYTAIAAALSYATADNVCLYFPEGTYVYDSQLTWNTTATLCMRGAGMTQVHLYYKGAAPTIDSGFYVHDTAPTYTSVDISDISFVSNANASYAFHAVQIGGPSTMRNVGFNGGAVSAFEGDNWNGQGDLDNLNAGSYIGVSPGCVNGLTFDSGPPGTNPSGQFVLNMPTVGYCKGIGLNFISVGQVTVLNAQIGGNGQSLVLGSNSEQNTFVGGLYETGSSSTANITVNGPQNKFVNIEMSNQGGTNSLFISGTQNVFEGLETGTGTISIGRGATQTVFRELFEASSSVTLTDSGAGTTIDNVYNVNNSGPMPNIPQQQHPVINAESGAFGTYDPIVNGDGQWYSSNASTVTNIFTFPFAHTEGKAWTAILTGQFAIAGAGIVPSAAVPVTVMISDASPTVTVVSGYSITFSVNATTGFFQMVSGGSYLSEFTGQIVFTPYSGVSAGSGPTVSIALPAAIQAIGFKAAGKTFTVAGCGTATGLVGGSTAGKFVAGSTFCTPIVTTGVNATNGYSCWMNDQTTSTVKFQQTGYTTTTATFTATGTLGATDIINFGCMEF